MPSDNCLLCLEELKEDISYPKYCNCKVGLHEKCLELINTMGLLCPICRIKKQKIYHNSSYIMRILEYPFTLFQMYSNIFTFIIMVIWSFIITILFIIPLFLKIQADRSPVSFMVFGIIGLVGFAMTIFI